MQSREDERKWEDHSLFQNSDLRLQTFHLETDCLPNIPIFTNLNVRTTSALSVTLRPLNWDRESAKVQNRDISVVKWLEELLV